MQNPVKSWKADVPQKSAKGWRSRSGETILRLGKLQKSDKVSGTQPGWCRSRPITLCLDSRSTPCRAAA